MKFTLTSTTLALVALYSASTTLAAPIHSEARAVQSCHATNHGLYNTYKVWVGVHYADGPGCDGIRRALDDSDSSISSYSCELAGGGNTQLKFNAISFRSGAMNEVLHEVYPMVDGFNCPDY